MENESKNIITSSVKVFNLLEELVNQGKATISELSKLTGLSQSTTQRIVNTLKYLKYVDQNPVTLEYFPSVKLYEVGNKVHNSIAIKNIARPFITELYSQVNETVNLGILDSDSIVYVDKLVSKSPLRVELDIGLRFPIYPSALGKAIAAFSDTKFSFEGKYEIFTEKTISSDSELEEQLSLIRENGYSIDDEEYIKGLVCISVPILNSNNNSIASISISMPKERYDPSKINYYVSMLNQCKRKIESQLYE